MDFNLYSCYQSQESDWESNHIRSICSERDEWLKSVYDFVDEHKMIRDRSPQRDRCSDKNWIDKQKNFSERDKRSGDWSRDYNLGSPRDDEGASNSSKGGFSRATSDEPYEDYPIDSDDDDDDDDDDDKEFLVKHNRFKDSVVKNSTSKCSVNDREWDLYPDNIRKLHGKGKEWKTSREGHRLGSRHRKSCRDGKQNNILRCRNNDNSYDNLEIRDSGECEVRNCRSKWGKSNSKSDFNQLSYKNTPNRTIIIRGLPQHISERDIWEDTVKCNLVPKDIRLIRHKDTGASRGFAFVEFLNTSEAVAWMEIKQGVLIFENRYEGKMHYSLQQYGSQRLENEMGRSTSEWNCRCLTRNFKTRLCCYKCGRLRQDEELVEGYEEVSFHPTDTVLLRGLDALTTEENVLQSIQSLSSLAIRSVQIGRDPVSNTSCGVCYLKMNCIADAVSLHNTLQSAKPVVDEKQLVVSYCRLDAVSSETSNSSSGQWKRTQSSLGSAAVAAAHWSHKKTSNSSQYTLDDVNRLAEYSANLYATNLQEKSSYLMYYQHYFREQISKGQQISLPSNPSATGAPTINKLEADGKTVITQLAEPPNGLGSESYPAPDVSTYQYDKSSGYYYDPYTTLYYDANSQYYYNQKIQKFLYWNATNYTYLIVPTAGDAAYGSKSTSENAQKEEELKKCKDKVKVAKRIAKDMEKWAKTLNHKQEIAKQNVISAAASQPSLKAFSAADIGFAVLERKDLSIQSGLSIFDLTSDSNDGLAMCGNNDNNQVASYDQGSDSEDEQHDGTGQHVDDKQFTDWNKLACLLCKRQFPSKDVLVKHQQLSNLHKQNLEQWCKVRGFDLAAAQQYKARVKKCSESHQLQPSKKETYIKSRDTTVTYEEPTKMVIGSDNLGIKLLQKMGWREGMGLGKTNQGMTSIIETERRSSITGLGTKSKGVVRGPGETYKDCVKRMMVIRYQEIEDKSKN